MLFFFVNIFYANLEDKDRVQLSMTSSLKHFDYTDEIYLPSIRVKEFNMPLDQAILDLKKETMRVRLK